jgi:hypothetical protein
MRGSDLAAPSLNISDLGNFNWAIPHSIFGRANALCPGWCPSKAIRTRSYGLPQMKGEL